MKDKQIIIRCTDDFKSDVKQLAENEGLSISAYITRLLKLQINAKEVDTRGVSSEIGRKK